MAEMNFNTDFNPASALLSVGMKQIEAEQELFQQEMALSLSYSEGAYESAHKAHNKRLNAAAQTALAEGIQAGASIGAGVTSLAGSVHMSPSRKAAMNQPLSRPASNTAANQPNPQAQPSPRSSVSSQDASGPVPDNRAGQPDPQAGRANQQAAANDPDAQGPREAIGGSDEYREEFNYMEGQIGQLREQKSDLGRTPVEVGVGPDGQPNAANGKTISEVSQAEYDGWRTQRDNLQQQIDDGDNVGISGQTDLDRLNSNIDNYDSYHGVSRQIDVTRRQQNQLVSGERSQLVNQAQIYTQILQMTYSGLAEVVRGPTNIGGSVQKAVAAEKGVEADRENTEAEWKRERASAMRSLADQSLSNAKSPMQYISEAIKTTQSAIQRLSNVQA